jgi:four helix bundle protein
VTADEMKIRTKAFALRVMKLVDAMPRGLVGQVVGRQLLRSATSVGANYRAVCRAQSRAEFASKLSIVVEETDETLYWLELLEESGMFKKGWLAELRKEANELLSITIASRKTSKGIGGDKENCASALIVNRQSKIDNPKIVNRQSSIVN